jgi:hypothetical protein
VNNRIPTTFITRAVNTLADVLSKRDIIVITARYALNMQISIPHDSFSGGLSPTARIILSENLIEFSDEYRYKIIREMCEASTLNVLKRQNLDNLKTELISHYGEFFEDSKSHDFDDLAIEEINLRLKASTESQNSAQVNHEITRILFISADPKDASHLRLGKEFSGIQDQLKSAKFRDRFKLEIPQLSVNTVSITQAFLDIKPHIVHFSGHGTSDGELCFEDQSGNIQYVEPNALEALFEQFSGKINCVILNACYSDIQAKAIANHIKYVIGMRNAIDDEAAIAFSTGFYQTLGTGSSVENAYKFGCIQIGLQSIPEHLTPVLFEKDAKV